MKPTEAAAFSSSNEDIGQRTEMTFGILTLATQDDYHKAIGLALSARTSNPGIPLAVACSNKIAPHLAPYFDEIITEDPQVRGFAHKLYLDRYSPFDKTFFFDSDVLLFRPLKEIQPNWGGRAYSACGDYVSAGVSSFGLNNVEVLKIIGREKLVHIDGAGHAYFEKPACFEVFDLARNVAANYQNFAGNIRLADEDVMNIVMTMLDLTPMPHFGFWSVAGSAKRGSLRMDVTTGMCSMIWADTGSSCNPYMMHFLANQAPLTYAIQLKRLFRKFKVRGLDPIFRKAAFDFYTINVLWPLHTLIRRSIKADTTRPLRDQLRFRQPKNGQF